jgi:hypothetical protein
MSDSRSQPDDPRAALRQRWLAHAAAAFDLMFDPQYQEQLVSFDQREQRAVELSRDLTAWLLQQHVNVDLQARPDESQLIVCPKCGRPGRRVTGPGEPMPERRLTTLAGEVALHREKWRCTTCRVVFFPPGPEAAPGYRGLQPERPAQGRAPGG